MCTVVNCHVRKKWFLFCFNLLWILVRYGAVVREAHLAFRSTQGIFIPPTVRPSLTESLVVKCAQRSRCRRDTRLGQVCTVPCLGRTEKRPPPTPLPHPSRPPSPSLPPRGLRITRCPPPCDAEPSPPLSCIPTTVLPAPVKTQSVREITCIPVLVGWLNLQMLKVLSVSERFICWLIWF